MHFDLVRAIKLPGRSSAAPLTRKKMAIDENTSLLHWNYFLALESDVERLARFVEFTSHNFWTYSIEITHLFLATASEVDVVAKQLCANVNRTANAANIEQYRDVLRRCFPEMESSIITIPRYGLKLCPWSNWTANETPDWWRDHNKVKHQRGEHFALAHLKNVLNAMAGLFLLNLLYYRRVINLESIEPAPSLFMPPQSIASSLGTYGGGIKLFFDE